MLCQSLGLPDNSSYKALKRRENKKLGCYFLMVWISRTRSHQPIADTIVQTFPWKKLKSPVFCNFRQFRWLFPEKLQHLTHWKSKLQFGRLVGKILCQKYDPYPYANPPKVGQTMKMGTTVMKTLMHLQEVSQSWKKMPGALVPAKKAPFFPVHLCDWTYHQTITCPAGIRILHQGERGINFLHPLGLQECRTV